MGARDAFPVVLGVGLAPGRVALLRTTYDDMIDEIDRLRAGNSYLANAVLMLQTDPTNFRVGLTTTDDTVSGDES